MNLKRNLNGWQLPGVRLSTPYLDEAVTDDRSNPVAIAGDASRIGSGSKPKSGTLSVAQFENKREKCPSAAPFQIVR
jgi:hypothetical protein